ncbi:YDG domain-containing protein [Paraburkholderia dilworthii]|uniref:YDG domain-containing protein n=1 Tax=Paraburkholderia dilworthii TaxID=948106 RepID=UPI00041F2344|nr:YDG domain-containing protein [Paraburkholderia dilworthii]
MKKASLNHVYRLVWNTTIGAFVAVAENTNARGKRSARSAALLAVLGVVAVADAAYAAPPLPTGGHIVAGQGSITQNGSSMTITQNSGKMVTNWNGFDIGQGNSVTFAQPNSAAVSLNRVIGGNGASQILGNMNANGQVWLINPGGVVIGKGATINVAGLVASSANISDSDFLAGKTKFTGAMGNIVNQGKINSQSVVALIGQQVTNQGTINAKGVALAAGQDVNLDFDGDGLVSVQVTKGALDALVSNEGQISADGSAVVLTARAADAAISSVVNNTGVIEARSLQSKNGRIVLDNDAANGNTTVAGTLNVSSADGVGGNVVIEGKTVAIDNAAIKADGALGGGTIKIGGGLRGEDTTVNNATTVTTGKNVVLSADATQKGDGGTIVAWSDGTNAFSGEIFIRGGKNGGNGGFAEVSGLGSLTYRGYTNGLSAHGLTGTLLLDPTRIDVYGGSDPNGGTNVTGAAVYEKSLEAQDVSVVLSVNAKGSSTITNGISDGAGAGVIEFHDLNGNGGDGKITMKPNVSFTAQADGGVNPSNSSNGLDTSNRILFDNSHNTLEVSGTGHILIEAGALGGGAIGNGGNDPTTNRGVFNLIAHGGLDATGKSTSTSAYDSTNWAGVNTATPGAGTITLLGADGLAISGDLTTYCGYVYLHADSDHAGGGNLVVSSKIKTNGGDFNYAWGFSSGQTATFTYGSAVDLVCTDGSCSRQAGTFRAVPDAGGPGGTKPANTTILGGDLNVGGNVNTSGWEIHGGATIKTDKDSTVTLDSGTKLDPSVLDRTGAATTTTGLVGLEGGTIAISHTGVTGLTTTGLQLKSADKGTNIFVSNDQGVVLGNGTVNRDGSVTGNTTSSTFLSASDLAYLQQQGTPSLAIGSTDHLGTIEVGHMDGTSSPFTFNASGQVGLIGGTAVVNGAVTNNNGSVFIQAADSVDHNTANVGSDANADQTATSTGRGNVVITQNGTVTAKTNAILAAATADHKSTDVEESQGGNFVNDRGSDAMTIGTGGRWLVYSTTPDKDVGRDLDVDFKVYEATYKESDGTYKNVNGGWVGTDVASLDDRGQPDLNGAITDPVGNRADLVQILNGDQAGKNGYLYSRSAVLTGKLVGSVTKTYDGTTATQTNTTVVTDANGTQTGNTVTLGNVAVSGLIGIDGDNVPLAILNDANLANAQFSDKNAGTDKTVTLSGVKLGVAQNQGSTNPDGSKVVQVYGYRLAEDTLSGDIGTITPKALTSVTTVDGKVYDGNTATTAHTTVTGVIADDNVSAAASGQFADKNAGVGKNVTVTTSLTGNDAGNYVLASGSQDATLQMTADISKRAITGTAAAQDKVYDGTNRADLTNVALNTAGIVEHDDLFISGNTGSFSDKNAGAGKSVVGSGLSLAGADAQNYDLTTTVTGASITQKTITASATAQNKVYDATTTATIGAITLNGTINGDNIDSTATGATFEDKNAGTGKAVHATGLGLTGADANNYVLANDEVAHANIDSKVITATANAKDKTYDGNVTADLSNVKLLGVIGNDVVAADGTTGKFDTKNVGKSKSVNGEGLSLVGDDSGNYVLDTNHEVATANITPKSITLTATASDKVYDGNTVADLTNAHANDVVAGDDLRVDGTVGTFADKNAGKGKSVNGSGLTLAGEDAQNYVFDNKAEVGKAAITPKSIEASAKADNKVYDGNTIAQLSDVKLSGLVDGDDIRAEGSNGDFDNRNAGKNKSVNGSGLVLTGNDANNYSLDTSKEVAKADIGQKVITATGSAEDKSYDGRTVAAVGDLALHGVLTGDQVSIVGNTGRFDNSNVGTNKPVNGEGLSLAGADAGNYILDTSAVVAQADVRPAYNPSVLVADATGVNGTAQATKNAGKVVSDQAIAKTEVPALIVGLPVTPAQRGDAVDIADGALSTSVLRMDGKASLGLNDEREERAQRNTLVVFRSDRPEALDNRGTFHVVDRGNAIELEGTPSLSDKTPDLKGKGSDWKNGTVVRADGAVTEYRVRMLNDGTLVVIVPNGVNDSDEIAASYGLAVAKKQLGIGVKAVKAVVIEARNGNGASNA